MGETKSVDMVWIVVNDIENSRNFFTKTLGFTEHSYAEEFGWAEMQGPEGGCMVGLAKSGPPSPLKAGSNAVITLTVDNIDETKARLLKKGVKMLGEIMEVPGHVKLQMFQDHDGNHYQLAQML